MADAPCLIFDDPRPISRILWPDDSARAVGRDCDRIVAYREPGMGSYTPWLAVYVGDHIDCRAPAHQVIIVYAPPAKEQ